MGLDSDFSAGPGTEVSNAGVSVGEVSDGGVSDGEVSDGGIVSKDGDSAESADSDIKLSTHKTTRRKIQIFLPKRFIMRVFVLKPLKTRISINIYFKEAFVFSCPNSHQETIKTPLFSIL